MKLKMTLEAEKQLHPRTWMEIRDRILLKLAPDVCALALAMILTDLYADMNAEDVFFLNCDKEWTIETFNLIVNSLECNDCGFDHILTGFMKPIYDESDIESLTETE